MKTTPAILRLLALPALLLLLAGCQLFAPKPPEKPVKAAIDYRMEIKGLPGATLGVNGLNVLYPDQALFGAGAALPLPGGMEVLKPLIDWLLENRDLTGLVVVRADAKDKAYAQQLAQTRQELLERLFSNYGIAADRLTWLVEVGDQAPLELKLQLPGGNSSGKKS